MAVVAPAGAPSRVDAERAAAELVVAGVEEVLLFGSVARGDATVGSDIDLVAIYADVDYSERGALRRELEAAARAVVECPVQVHVTDRPEWRARRQHVASSFERRIAADALRLAAASVESPVDWGKEMVLPVSDPLEALSQFDNRVLPRLDEVDAATRTGLDETDTELSAEERERYRLNRMIRLCTAAALAAETSLKALAVLYGEPTPTEKDLKHNGHKIAAILQRLLEDPVPEPAHAAAAAVFDRSGIDLDELSAWREKGTYPDDAGVVRSEADRLAATYALMATEIAGVVAAHLSQEIESDSVLDAALARYDRAASRIVTSLDVAAGPTPGDLDPS